jgi:three-Cys-motif partner protein
MAKHQLDEIGPWSEAKLDILRDYAGAYMSVLANQSIIQRVVYIDAFAGAGAHISRQTGKQVPGSPANALNIEPPFSEFHFIDLDHSKVGLLERLARGRADVHVYHDDCNDVLLEKVLPRCRYEDYSRGLCLLDPYKLAVDWNVFRVGQYKSAVEMFTRNDMSPAEREESLAWLSSTGDRAMKARIAAGSAYVDEGSETRSVSKPSALKPTGTCVSRARL